MGKFLPLGSVVHTDGIMVTITSQQGTETHEMVVCVFPLE